MSYVVAGIDAVEEALLKDPLDEMVDSGVAQFHALTCSCKSCSVEVVIAGLKASLLRHKLAVARGLKPKIEVCNSVV